MQKRQASRKLTFGRIEVAMLLDVRLRAFWIRSWKQKSQQIVNAKVVAIILVAQLVLLDAPISNSHLQNTQRRNINLLVFLHLYFIGGLNLWQKIILLCNGISPIDVINGVNIATFLQVRTNHIHPNLISQL